MSGDTVDLKCSKCGATGYTEIYTDPWEGVVVDVSKAVCHDCNSKEHPERYYDYQCTRCLKWGHTADGRTDIANGSICNVCKDIILEFTL